MASYQTPLTRTRAVYDTTTPPCCCASMTSNIGRCHRFALHIECNREIAFECVSTCRCCCCIIVYRRRLCLKRACVCILLYISEWWWWWCKSDGGWERDIRTRLYRDTNCQPFGRISNSWCSHTASHHHYHRLFVHTYTQHSQSSYIDRPYRSSSSLTIYLCVFMSMYFCWFLCFFFLSHFATRQSLIIRRGVAPCRRSSLVIVIVDRLFVDSMYTSIFTIDICIHVLYQFSMFVIVIARYSRERLCRRVAFEKHFMPLATA